jgi:hypothetical protein
LPTGNFGGATAEPSYGLLGPSRMGVRTDVGAVPPVSMALAATPGGATGIVIPTGTTPGSPDPRWSHGYGVSDRDDVGGSRAIGSGRSIAVDVEGNTIVAGWFTESIDLGDGPVQSKGRSDIFLLKLDPSGKRLWSRTLGGEGADRALGVAVNCDLQIIITGWFMDDVDLDSGILVNAGGKDAFVAAFSPSGDGLWSEGFGDEEDQLGNGVQVDGENNVVITGTFGGTIDLGSGLLESAGGDDVFVAELDSEGQTRWSKRFGGDGDQMQFGGGALDRKGRSDLFIAELDGAGRHLWSDLFGDEGAQVGAAVAVDGNGDVVALAKQWSRRPR